MFQDYSDWVQFQTTAGGLPANLVGYLAMFLVKLIAFHDVRNADAVLPTIPATGKHLAAEALLPRGDRPRMFRWPVPQRQDTQHPSSEEFTAFEERLETFLNASKEKGIVIERGTAFDSLDAYYLDGHELFHIHPVDKSLHCTLDPSDSKLLISMGWAEWFGLAGKLGLRKGTILFYAPRNEEERDVLEKVWEASVRFVEEQEKNA